MDGQKRLKFTEADKFQRRILDETEPCGHWNYAKVKDRPVCQICHFQAARNRLSKRSKNSKAALTAR